MIEAFEYSKALAGSSPCESVSVNTYRTRMVDTVQYTHNITTLQLDTTYTNFLLELQY